MISSATIFVPMPTGSPVRGRGGSPVREVEHVAPPGRRDQFRQGFAAELERQAVATSGPEGRRARSFRREEIEDAGTPLVGASSPVPAGLVGPVPDPARPGATAAPMLFTVPLDGPDRATAIDAVYRMIDGFGTGHAGRGVYFDLQI